MQSVFVPLSDFKDLSLDEPTYGIHAQVQRHSQILTFEFRLSGDFKERIYFPSTEKQASRRDELWKTTCFEAFFGWEKEPSYWEFNLSPSGNWNCYCFESYRSWIQEEKNITLLECKLDPKLGRYRVQIELPLDLLIPQEPLFFALSAVIEEISDVPGIKKLRYWALKHPEGSPDFHDRIGFRIAL